MPNRTSFAKSVGSLICEKVWDINGDFVVLEWSKKYLFSRTLYLIILLIPTMFNFIKKTLK